MTPGLLVAGRFLIDRVAGSGGMGAVFRAIDHQTGEPVALKIALSGDGELVARFLREARLLADLDHPAIVRHLAHGEDPAVGAWLAMEWLDGEDLAAALRRGPLSVADALAIARRAAEALALVHGRGLVHRDVKPANLFLPGGDPRRLKLVDFGIARAEGGGGITRTGAIVGTPAYVAPEQARGEPRLDARVDVYALGGVLFHCLAGRPVFAGDHEVAVLAKVLFAPPEALANVCPDAPPWLAALVDGCLAKDRARRPADAGALLAALEAEQAPRPPSAAAPPPALRGEQQVTSVVVALATSPAAVEDATVGLEDLDRLRRDLEQAAGGHQLSFDALRDGSLVVIIGGAGEATDRAVRAARAALALRRRHPGRPIAVATGRGEHSARGLGVVLERAAALAACAGDQIVVDGTSAALLEPRFVLVPGLEGAAARMAAERGDDDPRPLLGKRTRCVGRDRDLEALAAHVEECAAQGEARMVVVTAGPGVGKTRLRLELRGRLGVPAWVARADAGRTHVPFGVIAGLLRSAAAIAERDPPEVAAAALHRRLAHVLAGDVLVRAAAVLGEILSPRAADAARDPKVLGEQVRQSWEEWLAAETAAGLILIGVDDLHWADPPSVELLAHGLRALAGHRLVILAFARPEVRVTFPALFAARAVHEHRLGELGRRAAEALALEVLGADMPAAIIAQVVDRATGNAFYLEELIRSVAEGRGDELPGSVVAMVDRRLAHLPEDARAVLRVASVFGERFHEGVVAQLAGVDPAAVLERLCTDEVIVRRRDSRFAGQTEYVFRHALLRDGAYATLLADDRRALHALAAGWLAAAGDEDAAVIGQHHEAAGDADLAARCFVTAARQAYARNDFAGALALLDRALQLGAAGLTLGELQATRGKVHGALGAWSESATALAAALPLLDDGPAELRAEALVDAAYASFWMQDVARIVPLGVAAVELARRAARVDLETDAEALVSLGHSAAADVPAGIEWLARARARAAGRNSKVLAQAAQILYHAGQLDEAVTVTGDLVASARAAHDTATLILVLANHGLALAGRGHYAGAERAFTEAQQLARRTGATAHLARVTSIATGYHVDLDELDVAEATAERAATLATAAGFVFPLNSARIDQLFVAARRGDLARADELAAWITGSLRSAARGSHFWLWNQRFQVALAELELARAQPEPAVARARVALEQTQAYPRPKYQALARHALARARAMLGDDVGAKADARQAWEVARALGDPAVRLRTARTLAALTGEEVEDVASAAAEIARGLGG